VSQFLVVCVLDCSKSVLDVIFVLFTMLPSDEMDLPRDIGVGSRQPGGLLPDAAARHIQSVKTHMGQYCGKNCFPRDFLGLIQHPM